MDSFTAARDWLCSPEEELLAATIDGGTGASAAQVPPPPDQHREHIRGVHAQTRESSDAPAFSTAYEAASGGAADAALGITTSGVCFASGSACLFWLLVPLLDAFKVSSTAFGVSSTVTLHAVGAVAVECWQCRIFVVTALATFAAPDPLTPAEQ